MVGNGDADSQSEALRVAVNAGLRSKGYHGAVKRDTPLRAFTRRTGDAFALLSLIWVGMTFLGPGVLRAWAIPFFLVAVAMYGVDRALKVVEPGISRRLRKLFGGEPA